MLAKLHISNFVLITQLDVDFGSGFTVITGETGAGKSILLGALSLILGGRAEISGKGKPDSKVIVEGEFNIEKYNLEPFFEENNLDYDPQNTCLRREIIPSGKSRAFVNDTPVSLSVLKSLGEQLVDIHSQHENQLLLKPKFQLQFLDAFAKNLGKVKDFGGKYETWKSLNTQLSKLQETERTAREKEDYIRFQLNEIEELDIQNLNFEELQTELEILENSDAIKLGLQGASMQIDDGEINALGSLKSALSSLESVSRLSPAFADLVDRLKSLIIELDDINSEILNKESKVESNPDRAELLQDRMDKINKVLFKHGIKEIQELIEFQYKIESELNQLDQYSEELGIIQAKISEVEKSLSELAVQISTNRKKAAPKLEKLIADGLGNLGMPNAKLMILVSDLSQFSPTGMNGINLKFTANKGFDPQPLEKVASGGERSRLMLVLKQIHSSVEQTPTLILDEIDTGISGEIAAKTATMLAKMASDAQIISITHLPQVAGKGSHHLLVSKSSGGKKSETQLKNLNPEERKIEIARMLSGEIISEAAMINAEQLMDKN